MTDWAARARALVGTRFRPQGFDPATGLDCLGVAITVYRLPGNAVRHDYRLSGDHAAEIIAGAAERFVEVRGKPRPGDLLLLRLGAHQFHLAVLTGTGFVHADAGIGRVVETPGAPPWPIVHAMRPRRGGRG